MFFWLLEIVSYFEKLTNAFVCPVKKSHRDPEIKLFFEKLLLLTLSGGGIYKRLQLIKCLNYSYIVICLSVNKSFKVVA